MLHDDLRAGIDSFEFANEADRFSRVALWIVGVADDKRKFGDDAELARAMGHSQGFFGGDAFLHFLEYPIGAGFRAEEDHGAAGFSDGFQRCIRVTRHNVDARFTPPSKVEGREPVSQFTGVIFAKKEVRCRRTEPNRRRIGPQDS